MTDVVADTHAVLWYTLEPEMLSATATKVLDRAVDEGGRTFISAITLVEIVYLEEKRRIATGTGKLIRDLLSLANSAIQVVPVDAALWGPVPEIPRAAVPDMPDLIIAATALHLDLPLVTRDNGIQALATNRPIR